MTQNVEASQQLETHKKGREPTLKQLFILTDILIWFLILVRVGANVTGQKFIDWGLNIFIWVLIIVAALLFVEILLLTLFHKHLMEAPILLYGTFFLLVTIDVFIIIFILFGMGLIIPI